VSVAKVIELSARSSESFAKTAERNAVAPIYGSHSIRFGLGGEGPDPVVDFGGRFQQARFEFGEHVVHADP